MSFLVGCSMVPYRYDPAESFDFFERAERSAAGPFTVRTLVAGESEARDFFGIDVYGRGVQPVWLEIRNDSDTRARIVISSIDPKYFPPAEVAWFFKKQFSREGWIDLERRLIDLSLPRHVLPGDTVAGWVFTNLSPGTKAFNLDITRGTVPPAFEQFTFFIRVPGFRPDYLDVRFQELYPDDAMRAVTPASLPGTLADFDCCTRNADGTRLGRPVNLFFVADGLVLLRSLLRAGWVETPSEARGTSPASAHYLFGRPADGTFRQARDGSTDRSELDIWKTPVVVEGKPLWAAQLRHAVGRRFPIGERLFGVRLDPDVNEGRNYLLQNFWYAQTLDQWGLSPSGRVVSQASPEIDFQGNPWFSLDEGQAVIWLSDEPVPMNRTRTLEWPADAATRGEGS